MTDTGADNVPGTADDLSESQFFTVWVKAVAALNETVVGSLDTPGETDSWEYTIVPGQDVFLDVQAITPVAGVLVPEFEEFTLLAPAQSVVFATTSFFASDVDGPTDYGPVDRSECTR